MQTKPIFSRTGAKRFAQLGSLAFAALMLALPIRAAVVVDTIGGGPVQGKPNAYGFVNGNTFLYSQFNGPVGIALDSAGNLYLADKTNSAVRKITHAGDITNSETTTYIQYSTASRPIGVTVDANDNLYVLTHNGTVLKYNSSRTTTNVLNATLSNPTAITIDNQTNVYVTQADGSIQGIATNGLKTPIVPSGLNNPNGIAALNNGFLAVSDTGNHSIRLVNLTNGSITLLAGTNIAGNADGTTNARFNLPHGLAKAPNGALVVADRGNHRVRLIDVGSGSVSTLYGVSTNQWSGSYPGWKDGGQSEAASRDPIAVTVYTNGTVFVTELYYHLLRDVVGANLDVGGGDGGGNTNIFVAVPVISPTSGYFPNGQEISVTSAQFATSYYTTDGTEPTTNSLPVVNGIIPWRESLRDLTSLRVKSFIGVSSSETVRGQSSPSNQIGIPRDVIAGPGATVIVPVVINLRTNDQLRTIQFRVEVTPNFGAPGISEQFRSMLITDNDFVPVVRPAMPGTIETLSISPYTIGDTRGLTVAAIGTGANFFVKPFAVAVMLAVPIPASAVQGQSYQIQVLNASGSSDGGQTGLSLTPMSARTILVQTSSYLVGDSSPGTWYNAGRFGDGKLFNTDVNNAFYASFGIRVPYDFTDAFDAMDVGRPGRPDIFGGDGAITSYDWQKIYLRSIGLETNNWARTSQRNSDGVHTTIYPTNGVFIAARGTVASSDSNSKGSVSQGDAGNNPGSVWLRHAVVGAGTVTNVTPGAFVSIPVYVKVTPGYSLAGLQFRATLLSQSAPIAVQFSPLIGGNFQQLAGVEVNDILCSWAQVPSSAFVPKLQGSNLLGHVQFNVPLNAQPGQSYQLRFSYTDGAPDLNTVYEFENLSGRAWVQSSAVIPPQIISDEWKLHFFGNLTNALAGNDVDSDGDGFTNWQEYLAGTNPTNALSKFEFSNSEWRNQGLRGIALQWLTAPGKTYVMECAPAINSPVWTGIVTNVGDGNTWEFVHTNVNNTAQFYRIRLQP